MDVLTVAVAITVMGIMIALGAVVSMKVEVNQQAKQALVLIVLNIAVPSVILNGVFNTDFSDDLLFQIGVVFAISVVFHLVSLVAVLFLARVIGFRSMFAKKMAILGALGNTGFIGIPLCYTIFGPTGGLLAAIFDAGLDIVVFSVAVYLLQSGAGFQLRQLKAVLNLPLAAVVVGLSSAFIGLEPPAVVRQLAELLSGLAAPLAMLYIGILLHQLIQRTGFRVYPQIWFPVSLRLLLIPVVAVMVLPLLQLPELPQNVVVISVSMPTFMLAAILFSRYTEDEDTAVMTICLSTILSLATIPLIAFLASFVM
ncbi:AEC family transporter [Alkalicoccus chagannorensis]|uniref:AEC family transporter n=1 Tax=Alkalicoccus chagannorensis TaxID=427072 RepID=UPI00047922B8|nr:AEC family transporter [Alkalicoccus chagannorensis]